MVVEVKQHFWSYFLPSFKGTYHHALDSKNRLNIPSKLRAVLVPEDLETLVLTRGLDSCIYIYPYTQWLRLEERLRNLTVTESNTRKFIRMILGSAEEAVLDKQGRILLPQNLMEYASIQKEVQVVGMLDWIEIWNPAVFKESHDGFDLEKTAENMLIF